MKTICQFTSVVLLILTGCATDRGSAPAQFSKTTSDGAPMRMRVPQDAPSTPAPTLRMTSKTLVEFKRAINTVYITEGWKTEKDSDSELIFVKQVKDRAAKRWYNWSPENPVVVRERISISEADGAITATPKQEIVANFGSVKITDPATSYAKSAERFAKIQTLLQGPVAAPLVGSLDPKWYTLGE